MIRNRVHEFSSAYHEARQDFARIFPNFPSRFKITSSTQWSSLLPNTPKFWPLFQGDLIKRWSSHEPVPQNSRPLSWGRPSQNLAWLLPIHKISIPFLGELTKHFQFPQLFKTSTHPSDLTMDPKLYERSPDNIS